MPQLKRSRIDGKKYPWPHNPMVQPMKPIAAPLWKRAPAKPAAAFWGDPDGDGVINAFDCQPHNRRKQGPQHKKCCKLHYEYHSDCARCKMLNEKLELPDKIPEGYKIEDID